ncbi:hypothetical protein [Dysgonomonas sp. GY617]|uniref:hypothetical protein n=1 Tax=Dysgonomonas sp. GY617 TaxID=2780420 RepID=UPI001883E87E|nr:hypothetical protein [Dysgonomonas sp. GY617]MBF0578114.1 hypothetical protein [Dysgonomonas sp. GY617]
MDYHCFSREEYKEIISHLLFSKGLNDELKELVERCANDWDISLIGSNYFLSIIMEQMIKQDKIDKSFIESIYAIKDMMFLLIDELDRNFIDELFLNNIPEKRNIYLAQLREAKRANNEKKVALYEQLRDRSFEEDLLNIIKAYYESEIYH